MKILISNEEITSITLSKTCCSCNHKEIFHNSSYEEGTYCKVEGCKCIDSIILEGDFSSWSIDLPRYKCPSLFDTTSDSITREILELASKNLSFSSKSLEPEIPEKERTLRIKRFPYLYIP